MIRLWMKWNQSYHKEQPCMGGNLVQGQMYGLDPTNDLTVEDSHIKIGVGRDASDCMVNRGIMKGGGMQTRKILVTVTEKGEKL